MKTITADESRALDNNDYAYLVFLVAGAWKLSRKAGE